MAKFEMPPVGGKRKLSREDMSKNLLASANNPDTFKYKDGKPMNPLSASKMKKILLELAEGLNGEQSL